MYALYMSFKQSSFFRASSALFASSILANLISLAGFILLSKYYDIDTLGTLFTLTATISIVNIVIVLGYQQAIPLMKDKEVSAFFVGLACALSFLYAATFPLWMLLESWLFLSSFVYLGVLSMVSEMIFVRDQQTIRIVLARVLFPIILYTLSIIGFYLYGDDLNALMNFQIMALFLRMFFFYRSVFKSYFKKVRFLNFIAVLRKYKRFPRYIGPGIIFSTVAYQLPIVVAGTFFSPVVAAEYNMAFRLAFSPVQMLGGAITEAYTQFLSARFRNRLYLFEGFRRLRVVLFCFGVASTLAVYFFMPLIVGIFLDDKWFDSIKYIYALLPLLFAVVSFAPVTAIFQFTNSQRYIFYIHLTSLLISGACFSAAIYYSNFWYGVASFSTVMFARYLYVLRKTNQVKEVYEREV